MTTLYLIRGVPGSGKSTLARELVDAGVVDCCFEADQFFIDDNDNYVFDASKLHRAHSWCKQITENALEQGFNTVVSNTSTTEREVAVYSELAKQYGVKFVSVVVENRHNGANSHSVPEEKLQQMKNRFSIKL